MARLISDKIRRPLANEILFGKLMQGGDVYVSLKNDELDIRIEPHMEKLPQGTS